MKKFLVLISIIICVLSVNLNVFAHSGRTDSNGGHNDNLNISNLGRYHYHCSGNPAHLHKNEICPFKTPASTTNQVSTTPASTTPASTTPASTTPTSTTPASTTPASTTNQVLPQTGENNTFKVTITFFGILIIIIGILKLKVKIKN